MLYGLVIESQAADRENIISDLIIMRIFFSILCCFVIFLSLAGCRSKENYKADADERVYKIVDEKWQDDFGGRANYRISDVAPGPNDIRIERTIVASDILTLAEAVAIATVYNRDYQLQKELLYNMALDLRLTRHDFENQYFGGGSGGYNSDDENETIGLEANVGFNRMLARGTYISSKIAIAWVDVLTGNLRSGLTSIFNVAVTQPLLRGYGRKVAMENLTQAERDTLYQVRSFNRYRKSFVVSVISQYYMVLQQYDSVRNAEENYNTLNWLYEKVEKLAGAGRLPLLELDRVHQDRLKAHDVFVQARKEYGQSLDEFKIFLSLPPTTDFRLDDNELETLKKMVETESSFSEDEVIETALLRRLDLTNSADAVIDAQRKVYVAADALRAELNLVGSASAASSKVADRNTLGSFDERYGLGFEVDLPLDRVPEQSIYRKTLITLNQRQREYEQAADVVKLEIRQAHRDLNEAAERYKVYSEGLELARKRFDNTYKLLQYGRASSRRVLDAQNDLFDAQNEATDAMVNYAVAMLNFYRDSGVLQVRRDGMWQR